MGKKYIIEFESSPYIFHNTTLWKAKGFNALVFDQQGLDKLKPYEEKKPTPSPTYNCGWICPKCGKALSPFITECSCSTKFEITC